MSARPHSRRRTLRRLFSKRARGVVAMEFAILAVPFCVLFLGTMEVGYDFFVQIALTNAVNQAARGVQVGATQANATGTAETTWVSNAVCPALGGLLNCGQLYVSVTEIAALSKSGTTQTYYDYLLNHPPSLSAMVSSTNAACTGEAGQMMLLQAYYLSPTFIGMLVPAFSQDSPFSPGVRVHVTYASAGFVDEPFANGETCAAQN